MAFTKGKRKQNSFFMGNDRAQSAGRRGENAFASNNTNV
jgi:hypothetical protein